MEENQNLVEETTENTEQQTVEENVETTESVEESTPEVKEETFTKEQVDEIVAKKIARTKAKMQKQYEAKENKHRDFENLVMAGTQTSSPEEAYNKLNSFYAEKGINVPKTTTPTYSDYDAEILGKNDAREIIEAGYDEIVEEVERLTEIGVENMTNRDKSMFIALAKERQRIEDEKELASIGVSIDEINNSEFNEFVKDLNPDLSLKRKWELYSASQPKKEIKQMGSMKNTPMEQGIKEFYTVEEAQRLTDEDYKKHPELYEIIEKSMTKWK
jgi:hypothetical protein